MHYKWDKNRAENHIDKLCEEVRDISIKEYTREKCLENIKINEAYSIHAVHLYVDILNLDKILTTEDTTESATTHKKAIRFFDSHVRAIKFILKRTDCIFVDFHNQRLHAVIAKPYNLDSEKDRIYKAIAVADLIINCVKQTRNIDGDESIPAARIRIGIDSGLALAVYNGRKSNREPLFLGNPANYAAKLACGDNIGIYLTNHVRQIIDLPENQNDKLNAEVIKNSKLLTELEVNCEDVAAELKKNDKRLSDFNFSRVNPPLSKLDFDDLYYKSAKRQTMVSIYADIDGFTNFVAANLGTIEGQKNIIRVLHILRSEMDATLTNDYQGRRVRFIGDCLHGLICEGSNIKTNMIESADAATEAVGGIRSSFNMGIHKLKSTFSLKEELKGLGLAIGYELGEVSLTRIGKRDSTSRYAIGISTIQSEEAQKACKGNATKIEKVALSYLSEKYQRLFNKTIATDLTFDLIKECNIKSQKLTESKLYEEKPYANNNLKAHAKLK